MLPLIQWSKSTANYVRKNFMRSPLGLRRVMEFIVQQSVTIKTPVPVKRWPVQYATKKRNKTPKALKGSKSGKFFCGKSCQTIWRNGKYIQENHPNWKDGRHSYRGVINRNKVLPICRLCKANDKRVLAVHHIDEDRTNNTIENLAWLCHNCHHLVHRYPKERARFMAIIV